MLGCHLSDVALFPWVTEDGPTLQVPAGSWSGANMGSRVHDKGCCILEAVIGLKRGGNGRRLRNGVAAPAPDGRKGRAAAPRGGPRRPSIRTDRVNVGLRRFKS